MRTLAVALVAASALTLALGTPVAASCAPPAAVAQNAARAVAVLHGTVTDAVGGALTVRVDRVFKGQAGVGTRVFVGPGRGVGATSVDYAGSPGSEHVLYLIRGTDGQLETNACIGSHQGAVTAAEVAYFGVGTAPAAGSSPDGAGPAVAMLLDISPIWSAVVLAGAAGVVFLLLRRRRLKPGR